MPYRPVFFSFIFLCTSVLLFSQSTVYDWGDIPESDLKMSVYPQDSSASAVVLQDIGKINLNPFGVVTFNRSRRIKVLDVSAFEHGNLLVPYRERKGADELRDLDVQVTMPDGHTKKVKSDNVYTERLSRNVLAKKIFIPNLQKGSVIEYRYKMRSEDFLSLYEWYFQEDIPVRRSELELYASDNFRYVILPNTTRPFEMKDSLEGIQKGNYMFYTKRWTMSNVPALKAEPYITSIDEYRNFIKFQLRSFNISSYMRYPVASSWKQIARDLEKLPFFGGQYNNPENFARLWAAFQTQLEQNDSLEQKAEKALRFVNASMKWDGTFHVLPENNLDSAFVKKTGNSAELNLVLVALLRKAGLKAFPLLLSTRDNGGMYEKHPFVPQFNSVVALVRNEKKSIVLDATDPFLPTNHLNLLHYHGAAWMMAGDTSSWLKITAPEAAQNWYGKMQLNETGEMSGTFQVQVTGNIASDWRSQLDTAKISEFLHEKFADRNADIQFDSITFLQLHDLDQPLSVKFRCRVPSAASVVNDFIYCQPVIDFFVLENPFKSLKRNFPVEFAIPFKAQYVADLTIPQGYTVDELPEPARINLPDNAGKMTFTCSRNALGVLQVNLRMSLAKTRFTPEEYGALRQFFELAVEKTQFQLVLKRI